MALISAKTLSKDEQNFIRFVKACMDVVKLPLIDILDYQIHPKDLFSKIQTSCLLTERRSKLSPQQLHICFFQPPSLPDYTKFDVSLLYKLIRNLCPALKPTQGWGKNPIDADTQIGDDIERLRLFRNNKIHDGVTTIIDSDFEDLWRNLKTVIQRIQTYMRSKGFNPNYEGKLTDIKQLDLGDENICYYKVLFLLEHTYNYVKTTDKREELVISTEGPEKVICGDTARFKAVVSPENPIGWSIRWLKLKGDASIPIDTSNEKYSGSTENQLVIQSVCRNDEGKYQAFLLKEIQGKRHTVNGNAILLHAAGGLPIFDVWKVMTEKEGLIIRYKVREDKPFVYDIEWTKDGNTLDNKNKYKGGGLKDECLTIFSPTKRDKGKYTCTVKNAVGSEKKEFVFDVPTVEISSQKQVHFGSCITFSSTISSCPPLDAVEWQKSCDENTFDSININHPKYYGSTNNPASPKLVIPKVTFDDRLFYRLQAWNKIGKHPSNTVFLNVKGSPPNITISFKTSIQHRSMELIGNVFLYESALAVQKVFWTKDGKKLDTRGSGGRYSEVSVENPSLTIFDINECDAGSYQLTAANVVGPNKSDVIHLDVPMVLVTGPEEEDGSQLFRVTVTSIPAASRAQWRMKEKNGDEFKLIDANDEDYKGTSNSLPHPVLIVKQKDKLANYCFEIEVQNFIGSCKKTIPDDTHVQSPNRDKSIVGYSAKPYPNLKDGVIFADLFDDLAETFPCGKLSRLKDFIRNSNKKIHLPLFDQVESVRDCFGFLLDQDLLSPLDVLYTQYLLKRTGCEELYKRCLKYAEANHALCYYEKQTENGYRKIEFHVMVDISAYTQDGIDNIKKTVAAIVGCLPDDICVIGYSPSLSFFVALCIKDVYVKKLLTIGEKDKDHLSQLKIDYFIVDFIMVYLNRPKETRRNEYDDTKTTMPEKEKCFSERPHVLQQNLEKSDLDMPSSQKMLNLPHTARITMSTEGVNHISCLTPARMWATGFDTMEEIDENGHVLRKWDMKRGVFGCHSLAKNGDLLFLKDYTVYRLTLSGELQTLCIPSTPHFCIHSSKINGDILVGDIYKVTRYNERGKKIQEIEMGIDGKCLYVETIYITENINRDIIVSDCGKEAIVVVNKAGRHRFNYTGHNSLYEFHPRDVCTDECGNILVCNFFGDPGVNLINQDGQFLTYLKTNSNCSFGFPTAVCVDQMHSLYVGYSNTRNIEVYTYQLNSVLKERVNEKPKREETLTII